MPGRCRQGSNGGAGRRGGVHDGTSLKEVEDGPLRALALHLPGGLGLRLVCLGRRVTGERGGGDRVMVISDQIC